MKPRVLMLAYACDPQGTGEHWLGWGWAEEASRSFDVDLITTPKAEAAVRASCPRLGITPHFVETPSAVRSVTERIGGAWLRKWAWQSKALTLAKRLHAQKSFALVHQTTFHTFRVPFRAASLGIPSVWGPIAGGERVPPGFESYLGSTRFSEAARHKANLAWLPMRAIQKSLQQASVLFVSNRTTLNYLPKWTHAKSLIVPPNALRAEDESWSLQDRVEPSADDQFKLLYVGNCVATRSIPLALEAMSLARLPNTEFNIVGGGPALESWKELPAQYELPDIHFRGKVPFKELRTYYANADVLVFPALRDSGGSALLEAMARYVPVLCLDWAGPGEMIDAESGIKIPVTNPIQTVPDFAQALMRLKKDPELRARLAVAARRRAESAFRWQAKRALLEETYNRLIHGK
jgi:glycosyltransferase involved in cell wall biosynthesis